MKLVATVVFLIYLSSASSTFWFKNDFDRNDDTYRSSLSRDYFRYLRALSTYKQKLQTLGFYPIVSYDYVSADPNLSEDDFEDTLEDLLKKIKKEKKARKKLLKKKMKKMKKNSTGTNKPEQNEITTPNPTTATPRPIAVPMANIIYYWPIITTSLKVGESSSGYEHLFDYPSLEKPSNTAYFEMKPYDEDSDELGESDENITEVGDIRKNEFDELKKSDKTDNNTSNMDPQQKSVKGDEANNSENLNQSTQIFVPSYHKNVSTQMDGSEIATPTSIISTKTTQYPFTTEIPKFDEQEISSKISYEDQRNLTVNNSASPTEAGLTNPENVTEYTNADLPQEGKTENKLDLDFQHLSVKPTAKESVDNSSELDFDLDYETVAPEKVQGTSSSIPNEFDDQVDHTTDALEEVKETSTSIPNEFDNQVDHKTATLEKVEETSTSIPNEFENHVDHTTVAPEKVEESSTTIPNELENQVDHTTAAPEKVEESSTTIPNKFENQVDHTIVETHNGHIGMQTPSPDESITQLIDESSVHSSHTTDQNYDVHDAAVSTEINLEQSQTETNQYQYMDFPIDPKTIDDNSEARGLHDVPSLIIVSNDDRRSDIAIDPDDFFGEDTTDNLSYNLSTENILEQSKIIENISADIGTEIPITNALNLDALDEFDMEVIPMIPKIIKQLKQNNVDQEEIEIIKNSLGKIWPIILEEVNRDSNSSEKMNPVLSDLLNEVNKRVTKREATHALYRRPVVDRMYYDDVDYVYPRRRRIVGRRRRPVVNIYYK